MNLKILNRRTYLILIGAFILVAGLGSAALIYQRAGKGLYGAYGYEAVDGTLYPIMPQNAKLYRHNLELYGGKANVIMDDFRRWFTGLWQGKSLAWIIGCTTIMISFGFFYAANHLPERSKPEVIRENDRAGIE